MNPFASLLGRETKVANATALTWDALLGSPMSKTGVSVNVDTALRNAGALACVRVLAEGIAQLPLKLYKEQKSGKKDVATDHPVHWVLNRKPNAWMSSFEWRETGMYHACLAQGSFGIIHRVGGKVDEIIPLLPSSVQVRWFQGDLVYVVHDQRGIVGEFKRGEVFAVRGPSWNSIQALELVRQAAEAIGLSIAIEESQARLHANGARPSGILSTDAELSTDARGRLAKLFEEGFQGVMNAGKVPVLDNGLKFLGAAMTGADAQTLESRKYQLEEIARMFRVFPHMIGHSDKASTYASAEAFFTAHAVHSLGPWIERWEESISRDLLTDAEVRDGYFAKFAVDGLLRGDTQSRAKYFKDGLGTASNPGWLSPNDVRRLEDLDPSDQKGADDLVTPINMTAKGTAQTPNEPGEGDPSAGASDAPSDPAVQAAPAVVGDGAVVQDTALNGAQVAALQSIVQSVADGTLPASAAKAIIRASFPNVPEATVDAMLAGLEEFDPEEKEPAGDSAEDPASDAGEPDPKVPVPAPKA